MGPYVRTRRAQFRKYREVSVGGEGAPAASSAEQGQGDEQSKHELGTQPIDPAAVAWRTANRAKPCNEAQLEREE